MKKVIVILFLSYTSLFGLEIGKFGLPVPEKYKDCISSNQGLREAICGEVITTGLFHNAIDWAVPDKTPVYASKSGIVKTCYPGYYNGPQWKGEPQYGSCIIIQHYDGTQTLYAHLSLTKVNEGDRVTKGQEIALSGGVANRRCSGKSTGAHLHWAAYFSLEDVFEYGE